MNRWSTSRTQSGGHHVVRSSLSSVTPQRIEISCRRRCAQPVCPGRKRSHAGGANLRRQYEVTSRWPRACPCSCSSVARILALTRTPSGCCGYAPADDWLHQRLAGQASPDDSHGRYRPSLEAGRVRPSGPVSVGVECHRVAHCAERT